MEFKIGDTVALKSGGAAMTVCGFGDHLGDEIVVAWIDESARRQIESLPNGCLTPITRKAIHIDEGTIRYIWVFIESGEPIADHISMQVQA